MPGESMARDSTCGSIAWTLRSTCRAYSRALFPPATSAGFLTPSLGVRGLSLSTSTSPLSMLQSLTTAALSWYMTPKDPLVGATRVVEISCQELLPGIKGAVGVVDRRL